MKRDPVRENYEDQVIAVGDKIKADTFEAAEKAWAATPEEEKQRPWPRCKSIHCNRSLVCEAQFGRPCQGFDF